MPTARGMAVRLFFATLFKICEQLLGLYEARLMMRDYVVAFFHCIACGLIWNSEIPRKPLVGGNLMQKHPDSIRHG